MDIETIIKSLEDAQQEQLVQFIADKGSNSCPQCLQYNGKIYKEDDSGKPELPLHPNCRCKYEPVENSRLKKIKENLLQMMRQIQEYVEKTSAKATELLATAKELLKKAETVKSKAGSALLNAKIAIIIITIQCVLAVIEKLISVTTPLRDAMQKLGMGSISYIDALIALVGISTELKDALKELHYLRLKEPDQDPDFLPKSPEEARRRGFVKALDRENWYHRHKGQTGNVKYYHPITGQEVIFDKDGNIVTSPENGGTKNYGPNPASPEHGFYDVLPYWMWGNSEDDSTPFWNRVKGYDK